MRYFKDNTRETTTVCVPNDLFNQLVVWSDAIFEHMHYPCYNRPTWAQRFSAIIWLLNTMCEDILKEGEE